VKEKFADFSWDFLVIKVHCEGMKVYDAAMCTAFRL
jgi:hypothetical protein